MPETTPQTCPLYPVAANTRARLTELENKLPEGMIGRLSDELVALIGRGAGQNVLELWDKSLILQAISNAVGVGLSEQQVTDLINNALNGFSVGLTQLQVTNLINASLQNFEVPPSLTLATSQQHLDGTATDVATTPSGVKAMIEQRIMSNNGGIGSTLYSGAASNVHSVNTIYSDADGYTYMIQLMSATASVSLGTEFSAIVFRSLDLVSWGYIGMIADVGATPVLLISAGIVRLFSLQYATKILTVHNLSDAISVAASKNVDDTFANLNSGGAGLQHCAAIDYDGKIVYAIQASNGTSNTIRLGSWDLANNIFTYTLTNVASSSVANIFRDGADVYAWADSATGKILKYDVAANTFTQPALTGTGASEIYRQAIGNGSLLVRGRSNADGLDLLYFDKVTSFVDKFDVAATFPSAVKISPKNSDALELNGYVYIAYSDAVASIILQRVHIGDRTVRTTNVNRTAAKGAKLLIDSGRLLLMSWDYSAAGVFKIQEIAQ